MKRNLFVGVLLLWVTFCFSGCNKNDSFTFFEAKQYLGTLSCMLQKEISSDDIDLYTFSNVVFQLKEKKVNMLQTATGENKKVKIRITFDKVNYTNEEKTHFICSGKAEFYQNNETIPQIYTLENYIGAAKNIFNKESQVPELILTITQPENETLFKPMKISFTGKFMKQY